MHIGVGVCAEMKGRVSFTAQEATPQVDRR